MRSITQDSTGRIWLGVFGKGLSYYDGQKIKRVVLEEDGNFSDRPEVFHENNEDLYLNLGTSLKIFNPITETITDSIFIADNNIENGEIKSILFHPSENIIHAIYKIKDSGNTEAEQEYIILHSEKMQTLDHYLIIVLLQKDHYSLNIYLMDF